MADGGTGRWRLIPVIDAPGSFQMALDSWLLDRHRQGSIPPTLRFYTWSSPTISLGYHQRRYPPHWDGLCWRGQLVPTVRRPTGGRAVLHAGDLTYSVVSSGWRGDRAQVYRRLCGFLIEGWRSLGVPLHFGTGNRRHYVRHASCFATATPADLLTETGAKLVGSAQLWRGQHVLQHGSMRLNPDPELERLVFGAVQPAAQFPATLRELARSPLALSDRFVAAAQRCFGVTFEVAPLSAAERAAFARESESMGWLGKV